LSPFHNAAYYDTNDASVVLLVEYQGQTVLLTGDLPSTREDDIVGLVPHDITIFKAGHHGSKTSSSNFLLSKIKPQYAIVSAGVDNRYNHPARETLERLNTYAQHTMSTIDYGTITFFLSEDTASVITEK
jgi:competence protein ComEC